MVSGAHPALMKKRLQGRRNSSFFILQYTRSTKLKKSRCVRPQWVDTSYLLLRIKGLMASGFYAVAKAKLFPKERTLLESVLALKDFLKVFTPAPILAMIYLQH